MRCFIRHTGAKTDSRLYSGLVAACLSLLFPAGCSSNDAAMPSSIARPGDVRPVASKTLPQGLRQNLYVANFATGCRNCGSTIDSDDADSGRRRRESQSC